MVTGTEIGAKLMTELIKGGVGSAWALIIGWVIPTFIGLEFMAWTIVPNWTENIAIQSFIRLPFAERQAILLAFAAVFGLVLAAAKTPLYRILEGYLLWPQRLADQSTRHQRSRQLYYLNQGERAREKGKYTRYARFYEMSLRFPATEYQFAPTALSNAIRRFELYASDRYNLDSQLLWHHLSGAAPDRLIKDQENAATTVDFFTCLVYTLSAAAVGAVATIIFGTFDALLWLGLVVGLVSARGAYRLAVAATDEWERTVRAMVDHGRLGVAKAFGLEVPHHLADERDMWRAVDTLVRRPYDYSVSRNVPEELDKFRIRPSSSAVPEPSTDLVSYNGAGEILNLLRLMHRPWRKR